MLEYASSVWNNLALVDCNKVENIQRKLLNYVIISSQFDIFITMIWLWIVWICENCIPGDSILVIYFLSLFSRQNKLPFYYEKFWYSFDYKAKKIAPYLQCKQCPSAGHAIATNIVYCSFRYFEQKQYLTWGKNTFFAVEYDLTIWFSFTSLMWF